MTLNRQNSARKMYLTRFGKLPLLILFFCSELFAQRIPPTEIFAGFSDFRLKDCCQHVSLLGWQAAAHTSIYKKLGATADFGGQYKKTFDSTYHQYQFLFGPQVNIRHEALTGFGHALIGAMHYDCGSSPACLSDTGLMLGFGGGVDLRTSSKIALRLTQIDWLPTRFAGEWHKDNVRIGIGVVVRIAGSD